MYQVFCDNKLIIDSRIDELAVVNPIVDVGANIAGSFTFTFPSVHPFINEINRLTSVVRVERDDKIIFQGFCSGDSYDIFGNRKITCEGDLSYLNDSILRPARYQGETVLSLLTKYINQHNNQVEERKRFEIGNVTVTDPNDYIYCYTNMNSTMQEIKEDLIDDLGGFMRVRYENGHRYIDYLAVSTRNAQQPIELGKNIVDYTSNIDEGSIATRVIPLGAQLENQVIEGLDTRLDIKTVNSGLDYLESQSAINNFGIITKTIIFNDVTTPSILKTKGQQYLNSAQFENTVISIKAIDLGLLTNRYDKFELLDNVHIISEKHGMDRWFTLTSIKYNLNSPEKDVLSFGMAYAKSLSAKTTQISVKVNETAESINEASWLNKAKDEATALINGVDGGSVVMHTDNQGRPYEILVMDSYDESTATNIWRWNQNGFGHSGDGGQTYDTAILMNGTIMANFIKAGVLSGVEINNGSGTFKVNSNGAVQATNINIGGSGTIVLEQGNFQIPYISVEDNLVYNAWCSMSTNTISAYDSRDGSYANMNVAGFTTSGNLRCEGTKNRIVKTEHYGKVLMNAYETPHPTFSDEGHGVLDGDGVCYIFLDAKFLETIDRTHDYRVFLTKYGQGDVYVSEVTKDYVVIEGTPGLGFDWKIDCIQKDYNYANLEQYDPNDDMPVELDSEYEQSAAQYLKKEEETWQEILSQA